ncbi:coproporphyrinogen III oxidase family protein [bacterium]|nr:MAG: coproporphyrinogen III oxidase family protein [bacterium]
MTPVSTSSLRDFLASNRFAAYAYSYPHKTAYQSFPPVSLRDVWEQERRDALFAYLHVPFCEMRCGFCNLFTRIERDDEQHSRFLDALERQLKAVSSSLVPASFARMAVGGGTPTILSPVNLNRLFDIAETYLGASPKNIPCSVETSPATATIERLSLLKERGVSRVSMGVQSFIPSETRAMGRPQQEQELFAALNASRECNFPIWNLDFIYGLPEQTIESWLFSLKKALEWQPNEIFLYPLYIRPLTGLGKRGAKRGTTQLDLYRAGRDFLRANGFKQMSMRMFARHDGAGGGAPLYCCQSDGMIGLGAGARSYTSHLHYSTEYAVASTGVQAILDDYMNTSEADFALASYGFWLNEDERKRRFLIQSLLNSEGLDFDFYEREFGSEPQREWPLDELCELELATEENGVLRLTDAGMERSDELGPFFASDAVRAQMEGFTLR